MNLEKVERVYTSYAKIYDRVFGKVFHEGRQSVIQNLNAQRDEKSDLVSPPGECKPG